MKTWHKKAVVVTFALCLGLLGALDAAACPVCYGEGESGFLDGARLSVLFMGVLTYVLIGGGVGVFFALRRRVRQLQDLSRGTQAVAPETSGGPRTEVPSPR